MPMNNMMDIGIDLALMAAGFVIRIGMTLASIVALWLAIQVVSVCLAWMMHREFYKKESDS